MTSQPASAPGLPGLADDDTATRDSTPRTVAVLLPLPLDGPYDYRVPSGACLTVGQFVRVPFGPRQLIGVVWGPGAQTVATAKLRDVTEIIDVAPMADDLRTFIDWVARYTMATPGAVVRMAMSVPQAFEAETPQMLYSAADTRPARMTPQRQRIFDLLTDGPAMAAGDLAREAAVGAGVVRALARDGHLVARPAPKAAPMPVPDPTRPGLPLSDEQSTAAHYLSAKVTAQAFAVDVLDGVTGSGKTEVYFEAIATALRLQQQVLVLLPEIALGAQWLGRFEARFGARPAEWHSGLGQAQRRRTWRAVAAGRASVVVGARSALFLPYRKLGLIVVDEEHDPSFKQEDGVIYNARDMAVVRARQAGFPVVLVSATPAMESHQNVRRQRYGHVALSRRHANAAMPEISLVDMRATPPAPGRWLSPPLTDAISAATKDGAQAMLFLNRRGYAPLTLCRACGHRLQCPNCSAWLVEHRLVGALRCHHCDHAERLPQHCPSCEAGDALVACGPGVERLAEEAHARWPEMRVRVMASDTVSNTKLAMALVDDMLAHNIDLLIGTQMVTKGHHFPNLTVVGVIDADLGLAGGDLRAAERTYTILAQVAGRAGRADRPGHVFLQSYIPEHPVMQALAAGDRDRFVDAELDARRAAGMPPFSRLVAVIVSGPDEAAARAVAVALGRAAPRTDEVDVVGPAPAPFALLRGRYRFRLLLRASRATDVQAVTQHWLAQVSAPSAVRVGVDVDPYSFL